MLLKDLNHPNIIKLHTSFVDHEYLYLVMDFASQGDLMQLINKQKQKGQFYFSEKEIWRIGWQLAIGILFMHANNVIHRDIKAMNVFMFEDRQIKIGDLGESRVLGTENFLKGKTVGTPLFLAPEVIKEDSYDHRIDIWALGCLLYNLATLEPPFVAGSYEELKKVIAQKEPKPIQACYSMRLKEFIFKLLEKRKRKRPFITEVFKYFPESYQLTDPQDITNF